MSCECCDYEWTVPEQRARGEAERLLKWGYSGAYVESILYSKYNYSLSLQSIAKLVGSLEGKSG
jgi:hypothetical protein